MLAQFTFGRILLGLAVGLYVVLAFLGEDEILEPYRKRLWFVTAALGVVGLVVFGFESGFLGPFVTLLFSGWQPLVICGISLLLAIGLPRLHSWLKGLPRYLSMGLTALATIAVLAIWQPGFIFRYWFPVLMSVVYMAGLLMTWQRHHSEPPSNYHFNQGGQYAFGYSMDYRTPWEQSKLRGKIFATLYPILIAIDIFGRSAEWGQGWWFGCFGVVILITELILLFQL